MDRYKFKAKVIVGRGLGGRIGFPTANLKVSDLPLKHGVYLVEVKLAGKLKPGLMHWGPKKTFDREVSCEIYLKHFNKDIYGRELEVEVGRKIRDVKKFKNIEELKNQINKDLLELDKA